VTELGVELCAIAGPDRTIAAANAKFDFFMSFPLIVKYSRFAGSN
jgi:hypothetical protein